MAFQRGEVAVTGLLNYLRKQFRGKKDRPELIRFMLLLMGMTIMLCMYRLSGTDRDDYDLSSKVKDLLNEEEYSKIEDEETYFNWVKTTAQKIWETDDAVVEAEKAPEEAVEESKEKEDEKEHKDEPKEHDQGATCTGDTCENNQDTNGEETLRPNLLPISVMVLRQFRVKTRLCDDPKAFAMLPKSSSDYFVKKRNCVLTFADEGDKALDIEPFGSNPVYNIVSKTPQPFYSVPISGHIGNYNHKEKAFSQAFYYNQSSSAVLAQIDKLLHDHWTGIKTRALILEIIMYSQATKSFVFSQVLSEVSSRGTYQHNYISYPFSYEEWTLTTWTSLFLLFLDICVVVWFFHAVYKLIIIVVTNWEMLSKFSEGASVIFLVVLLVAYYKRFNLWWCGLALRDPNFLDNNRAIIDSVHGGNEEYFVFDTMANFGFQYQNSFTWFSVAYLCAWTRLLVYLRHNPRLNALTETMQQCAGQLLGMAVVGLLVQMGFVAVGNILYGNQIEQFRSLRASFGTLQAVLLGIFDTWDAMQAMHPHATPIFVTSYFLICWLILLNMVVGVIGASFDAVQENMEDPDWNVKHMTKDLYNFITGFEGGGDEGEEEEGSVALPSMPTLANIITTLEETPGTHITPDDFKAILPPDVTDAQAECMLEGGRHEFAGKQPTTMNMERAVETIYERVEANADNFTIFSGYFDNLNTKADAQKSKLEILEAKIDQRIGEIEARLDGVGAGGFRAPAAGGSSGVSEELLSRLETRLSQIGTSGRSEPSPYTIQPGGHSPTELTRVILDVETKLSRMEGSAHVLERNLSSRLTQLSQSLKELTQLQESAMTRVQQAESKMTSILSSHR